LYSIISQLGGL